RSRRPGGTRAFDRPRYRKARYPTSPGARYRAQYGSSGGNKFAHSVVSFSPNSRMRRDRFQLERIADDIARFVQRFDMTLSKRLDEHVADGRGVGRGENDWNLQRVG